MKIEIKKVENKKYLFLIFENKQSFRIITDGNIKYTKEMLDVAILSEKTKKQTINGKNCLMIWHKINS